MAEKTTDWPSFRINPATKKRLTDALERAKNESPLMRVIDAILNEAVDQIEAQKPKALLPFVASMRAQLGLGSLMDTDNDLDTRLAAIEAQLAALTVRETPRDSAYLKAAEEPKRPRKTS